MDKTINKNVVIFYIVSMIIAFTTRYGDYQMGFGLQVAIGLFWIIIVIGDIIRKKFKVDKEKFDFVFFLKIYFIPHLFIHLYTIVLMIIGKVEWKYMSTNITVYIPTLLAISSVYLFGVKSYKYNCIALIFSWVLSVLISLAAKGFGIFPHAIIQAYINPLDTSWGMTANYLELHDLVLALGYIIIYNVYIKNKITKKNAIVAFMILIILILGMKRISIIGIAIACLFILLLRFIPKKYRYKVCFLTGIAIFMISYLYIYSISNDNILFKLLSKYNINVMGRNYYFEKIISFATFSPSFLGIGRNVVTKLLQVDFSYLGVGGVHSDIIKMYVENGFIVFGIWLWYYLIKLPKILSNKFNVTVGILYCCLVIYTFTMYLTDNTENYFICQMFSMIIPMTYALKAKEETKQIEEK